jgi:molecular chaperone DnaK (HSP70)
VARPEQGAPEVVAEGAAIMTKADAPVVTDVLSHSIGIEAQILEFELHGVMMFMLARNEALPISRTFDFTGVTNVTEIDLYEGESKNAQENTKLGQCVLIDTEGKKIFVKIRATRDAVIELYSWKASEDEPGEPNIKLTRAKPDLTAEVVEAMRTELDRRLPLVPRASQSTRNKRKRSSRAVFGRKKQSSQ